MLSDDISLGDHRNEFHNVTSENIITEAEPVAVVTGSSSSIGQLPNYGSNKTDFLSLDGDVEDQVEPSDSSSI